MEHIAILIAAISAAVISGMSGFLLIPFLRKLKFGQTINEIGPAWHKDKQGTPTMGGILFILGSIVGMVLAYPLLLSVQSDANDWWMLILCILITLGYGVIGFIDDYLKVVRKQNLGLSSKQKLLLQTLVSNAFLITLFMMDRLSTIVKIPFLGSIDFGIFFYPLSVLLVIGLNNAVNLTDGVDGLCTSVSFWAMGGFLLLLSAFSSWYLATWSAALVGGCVGFLFWNFYPAKVFMGDTGSLFLGGAVVTLGFGMGRVDILIILSVIYFVEVGSVMLQQTYFKLTRRFSKDHVGRRIFKMSPIHHHFEMCGWSEVKICAVFSVVSIISVIFAYMYAVIWA